MTSESTSTEPVPRASVLAIVRSAADELRTTRARLEDPAAVSRALASACRAAAVSPHAFDAAVASDPELESLKSAALDEALAGSTDPGPHAEISRESMSGQPGDTTKSRSDPEP